MQISTLKNWTLRKIKLTDIISLMVGAAIGIALSLSRSVELILVLLVLGELYLSAELAYRRGVNTYLAVFLVFFFSIIGLLVVCLMAWRGQDSGKRGPLRGVLVVASATIVTFVVASTLG